MSRRLIRAAVRRFLLIYLVIVAIGGAFFYLALSGPQPSNKSFAYSNSAASALWIQYLFFLGSQTLYVIPVVLVKGKLRMGNRTVAVLSAFPVVYIFVYGAFLNVFVKQSGRVDLGNMRGILIGLIPFGAGIVPLIGVLTVARRALSKLSKRRSGPSTSWTTSEWARSTRGGENPFPRDSIPEAALGREAAPTSDEALLEPQWVPEAVEPSHARQGGEPAASGGLPQSLPEGGSPRHADGTW